jgi:sec-independent protein translocase protein TatC
MLESDAVVKFVRALKRARYRIIAISLVFFAFSAVAFVFSDTLINLLVKPLQGKPLYFLSPTEGFIARISLSLYAGLALSIAVIPYPAVSAIASVLPPRIIGPVYRFIPVSTVLMYAGILFGYFFIYPPSVRFLLTCGGRFLSPMISAGSYVTFSAFLLLGLGLFFELPVVMLLLGKARLLKSKTLMAKRKYAILGIIVVMAVLSPTQDAFTLLVMAVPVILLFEAGIWCVYVIEKLDRRRSAE